MPTSIYDYTDYRRYLKDWLEERKGRPSLRGLAKKLGCSPALLSGVLNGVRDISQPLAEKVPEALGLDAEERAYFLALVAANQGETLEVRRQAHGRVMTARRFHSARRLGDAMHLVFSRWYYGAILELSRCAGFREDPAWIAATMVPTIHEDEAAAALETLLEAGFLLRGPDGRLVGADTHWVTEHDVTANTAPSLRDLHRWVLARASDALTEFQRDERHFGTMCFAAPEAALPEIKRVIARFEEELITHNGPAPGSDRLFQLSIQLFPLSRPIPR